MWNVMRVLLQLRFSVGKEFSMQRQLIASSYFSSKCSSSSSFNKEQNQYSEEKKENKNTFPQGTKTYAATADEHQRIVKNWGNAFFGRVHYEPGMHENFQRAVETEEEESLMEKSNHELFPNWPEDEEAPMHEFNKLSDALKKRYIVNRLCMGERRVRYAVDYGSLFMMQHLNLGDMMINEAERLLHECGWLTEAISIKIEEVRECSTKAKFDFDLD